MEIGCRQLDARPELGLAAGGYALTDAEGRTITEAPPGVGSAGLSLSNWLAGDHPVTSQWILREEAFRKASGFDETLWGCQDTDLGVRLCLQGSPMAWLSEITCRRLVHPGASSRDPRKRDLMLLLIQRVAGVREAQGVEQEDWHIIRARVHLSYAAVGYALPSWLDRAKQDLATAVETDSDLLVGSPPPAVAAFVDYSVVADASDPLSYLSVVFDHLPVNALSLREHRRRAFGWAAARTAFLARSWGDARILRRAAFDCVRHDPTWLRNRGIVSLLGEAMLGATVMSLVRRVV